LQVFSTLLSTADIRELETEIVRMLGEITRSGTTGGT
jgi:hypothetical protein